jgi:hypothetical protein
MTRVAVMADDPAMLPRDHPDYQPGPHFRTDSGFVIVDSVTRRLTLVSNRPGDDSNEGRRTVKFLSALVGLMDQDLVFDAINEACGCQIETGDVDTVPGPLVSMALRVIDEYRARIAREEPGPQMYASQDNWERVENPLVRLHFWRFADPNRFPDRESYRLVTPRMAVHVIKKADALEGLDRLARFLREAEVLGHEVTFFQ